jgi:hypothetical protein
MPQAACDIQHTGAAPCNFATSKAHACWLETAIHIVTRWVHDLAELEQRVQADCAVIVLTYCTCLTLAFHRVLSANTGVSWSKHNVHNTAAMLK